MSRQYTLDTIEEIEEIQRFLPSLRKEGGKVELSSEEINVMKEALEMYRGVLLLLLGGIKE